MRYGCTFAAGKYKLTDITKDADSRLIIFHADVENVRMEPVFSLRCKKRKRRSRDKSYGLAFNGQYILLLHTKMTPYNIRPFRLLTDRFRISSVSLQPCATKSMFLYVCSPRGGSTGVKRFQSARVNFPNQCPPSHNQQQNVASVCEPKARTPHAERYHQTCVLKEIAPHFSS